MSNLPQDKWFLAWPVIILAIIFLWPVGLILLVVRVNQDKSAQMLLGGLIALIGWAVALIFGIATVATMADSTVSGGVTGFMVVMFAGGVLMIRKGHGMKSRGKRVRRYIDLVVNQGHRSVDGIASIMGRKDPDGVLKEIQDMIDQGFLSGFRLDPFTRELVSKAPQYSQPIYSQSMDSQAAAPSLVTFTCKGCGANNQVQVKPGNPVSCEYCQTPARLG